MDELARCPALKGLAPALSVHNSSVPTLASLDEHWESHSSDSIQCQSFPSLILVTLRLFSGRQLGSEKAREVQLRHL